MAEMKFKTNCCGFEFSGLENSPEANDICVLCGRKWDGVRAQTYLDEDGGRGR